MRRLLGVRGHVDEFEDELRVRAVSLAGRAGENAAPLEPDADETRPCSSPRTHSGTGARVARRGRGRAHRGASLRARACFDARRRPGPGPAADRASPISIRRGGRSAASGTQDSTGAHAVDICASGDSRLRDARWPVAPRAPSTSSVPERSSGPGAVAMTEGHVERPLLTRREPDPPSRRRGANEPRSRGAAVGLGRDCKFHLANVYRKLA